MERFESLFVTSSQRENRIDWGDPQLIIDLSAAPQSGLAHVTFTATARAEVIESSAAERWADLVPASVHPISVWLNSVAHTPTRRGSYHALQLPRIERDGQVLPQQIKVSYPIRLTREPSGGLSGIIALPPVPNADVRVLSLGRSRLVPTLKLDQTHTARAVSLRGALAVVIPASESGQLLQRQDLNVSLHSSGEGADVKLRLETLLRGDTAQGWVSVAPAQDALLKASLDGKPAVTSVIDHWHAVWVVGQGQHVIEAVIRVPVDRSSGQPKLTLSPQRAPRAKLSLTLPGEREVKTEPALPILSEVRALPKNDPNRRRYAHLGEDHQGKLTIVRADLPPLKTLSLRWTERRITPEREAPEFLSETYQLFSLQEGLLKGEARVELDVIKGELKRLEIEVPPGVVLYHLSGAGVEGWVTLPAASRPKKGSSRKVRVTFGEPRKGESALSVKWQRVLSTNEPLNIPLIRPLAAFQESGVIALYDGDRVGFTPAQADKSAQGDERLIPVGQESIPQHILQLKAGEKVSQAFRHVQAPTTLITQTTTERARELRFDAQLDTLYSLRDGAVRAQSQLLVNLKSGRLETLVLALPSSCSEPQVSGPSINRVEPLPTTEGQDPKTKRYQVRFTRRLEGALTLDIDVEQLLSDDSALVAFPRLVVEGAELTQGHLGLTSESGLEVTPAELKELRRVTIDEIPRSIKLRAAREVLYGYRFSRDWSLNAKLKRHKIVETLSAEATQLEIQSYLLESGQRVDFASYTVSNRDRRAVKIKLPAQASVQEVLVNQATVRARAEGAYISVPLPQNQTVKVGIRYEVPNASGSARRFELTSPTSDMRTSNITWRLFFSQDRQLWSWEGELRERPHQRGAARLSFSGLTHSAHFDYDLMPAQRDPLRLNIGLSVVLSPRLIRRLNLLGMLALLLIGLRRGLLLGRRQAHNQPLRYAELLGLLVLSVQIGVYLYQKPWYAIETLLFESVATMTCVGAITYIAIKLFELISSSSAKRRTLERSAASRPETKETVLHGDASGEAIAHERSAGVDAFDIESEET